MRPILLILAIAALCPACSTQHAEGFYKGECEDGKDNDDDALVDCEDDDCSAEPACRGETDADSDSDADGDADTDSDGDTDSLTPDDMPADPSPFTITVTGAYAGSLAFDDPTCEQLGNNFRMMWRKADRSHVFVLIAEMLSIYAGAGDYDPSMGTVRAKLQEEAGGYGYYFATDPASDAFSLTIDYCDTDVAWGHFDVATMSSDKGGITVSPTELPIWCPTVENADE